MTIRLTSTLAVALLISACSESSILLHIPQNRFDLPEAVGKKEISLQAGYQNKEYLISLSDNPISQPINMTNPPVKTQNRGANAEDLSGFSALTLGFGYGITDNLELSYKVDTNRVYTIKYMLLGEPQARAKVGNWSLALTFGYATSNESGNDAELFHSTDYEYNIHSYSKDLALISGYRPHDRLLVYAGVFTTRFDYGVDLTVLDTLETSHYSGDASMDGANLGLHIDLNPDTAFEFEYVHSKLETGRSHLSGGFTGINFRTRF